MSLNKIVVIHLGSDGGNFLINCLSMSDDIWFNNLSKRDKIAHYFEKTLSNNKSWLDVTMWTVDLPTRKKLDSISIFFYNGLNKFSKNMKIIIKSHYYFFEEITDVFSEFQLLKKNNSFVITFQNPIIFSCLRNFFINDISNCCGYDICSQSLGSPFPVDEKLNFLTVSEYSRLTNKEKKEFEKKYNTDVYTLANNFIEVNDRTNSFDEIIQFYKNLQSYDWNVNWFLNENDTVLNVKKLYDVLELNDFNEKLIRKMYKAWIYKLDEIKKYQIDKHKSED